MRLAEGVILNLIITTYPSLPIVLLWVTPTAKRNSYRVAILVGRLPRVACFARNPGLGNRNSVRVAAACGTAIAGLNHNWLLLLVDDINTKSHGGCCRLRLLGVGGDGSRKTSFPPCRRPPNAMRCMTTTTGMVQKAAIGRKKSPPLAVKKQ